MNESDRAGRIMEILVGIVCGVIGLGLLTLVALLVYTGIERGDMTHPFILVGLPIAAGMGVFFGLISYRLVLNRAAKVGGGLLSPTGWKVAGTIFATLAAMLTIAAIWQGQWGILAAPLFAIIFAKWCFSTAKTRSGKSATNSSQV